MCNLLIRADDAAQMAEQCRHIRWKDWIAKRRGEVIDVGELEAGGKRRRVVASGLLAGLVGGVLLVYRLDRL